MESTTLKLKLRGYSKPKGFSLRGLIGRRLHEININIRRVCEELASDDQEFSANDCREISDVARGRISYRNITTPVEVPQFRHLSNFHSSRDSQQGPRKTLLLQS